MAKRAPAKIDQGKGVTRSTKEAGEISLSGSLLLILVCFLWGANAVSIRITNQGIPPILTAAVRSAVASFLIALYAREKGQAVLLPRGQRHHGAILGCLFALDFLFIYWGLSFTTASRSVIFLYTHPFWVAVGAHFFLRGDRLSWYKGMGLILAFSGILAVFAARSKGLPPGYRIGDIMEMAAALFWAATTLYIKKMVQSRNVTHYQTLFAQLFYSIPVLGLGSLFLDSFYLDLNPLVVAAFAFQCLAVGFVSYVLWYWMIGQFRVSSLTAFTFLAPLFGVFLGSVLLSEAVMPLFWLGLGLVAAGIYFVNRSPMEKSLAQRS